MRRPLAPHATTLIAMDAPPPMENCRPFVHVASLLRAAGVHAPQVLAQDLERGFLLLTDLGTRTYLAALDAASARHLYLDALDALVRFQSSSRNGVLPPYDEPLLRRELDLFPDWYIARHLRRTLAADQRQTLDRVKRSVGSFGKVGETRSKCISSISMQNGGTENARDYQVIGDLHKTSTTRAGSTRIIGILLVPKFKVRQ
jgi:aminoglycoside/choline kinase family phosphotransferase